jgi:hypothetical protein
MLKVPEEQDIFSCQDGNGDVQGILKHGWSKDIGLNISPSQVRNVVVKADMVKPMSKAKSYARRGASGVCSHSSRASFEVVASNASSRTQNSFV